MNEDLRTLLVALLGFLGGGGGALLFNYLKDRREAGSKERKDTLAEAYEFIDRIKKERDLAEEEARQERKGHHECRVLVEQLIGRVETLEELMRSKGWDVKPWYPRAPHGSDLHSPLIDRRVADDPDYPGPERRKGSDK